MSVYRTLPTFIAVLLWFQLSAPSEANTDFNLDANTENQINQLTEELFTGLRQYTGKISHSPLKKTRIALLPFQKNKIPLGKEIADQFNQIRGQIDNIASDANFDGTNLIGSSPDSLEVTLSEDGSLLAVQGTDSSSAGLGINSRTFGSNTDIQAAIADIESAQSQVRSNSVTFSSSTSTLQNRIAFTDNLTNTLAQGVANLTQTDLNEEAASLLSLQTRQALGSNALTIATANEQAVLGLFD